MNSKITSVMKFLIFTLIFSSITTRPNIRYRRKHLGRYLEDEKPAEAKPAEEPAKPAEEPAKPAEGAPAEPAKPAEGAPAEPAKPAEGAPAKEAEKPAEGAPAKEAEKPAEGAPAKEGEKPAEGAPAKEGETPAEGAPAKEGETPAEGAAQEGETPAEVVEEVPKVPDLECKPELLMSFGMTGMITPLDQPLEMCPQIQKSCCNYDDEMMIYSNWSYGKEEENLIERMEWHQDLFNDLIHQFMRTKKFSEKLMKVLETKAVSNCKILARRISQIQVQIVGPQIETAFRHLHDFFEMSYKGFYCSLCDAEKHQFFDLENKKIIFGEKFCREIMAGSLHVLLYFHIYFIKYANIVTKFLNSCDYEGNFKDKEAHPKYIFTAKGDHHRMLNKCNKERNNVDWFESCEKVCKKFDLMKYDKFFAPKLKKYSQYTEYIKKNLDEKDADQKKADLLRSATEQDAKHSRILTEKNENETEKILEKQIEKQLEEKPVKGRLLEAEKKKKTEAELKAEKILNLNPDDIFKIDHFKKFKDKSIFKSGINAIVKLETFDKEYQDPGIDFYLTGKESVITITAYKTVKEKKIKELSATKAEEGEGEGDKPAPQARTLSNAVGGFSGINQLTIISFLALFFKH